MSATTTENNASPLALLEATAKAAVSVAALAYVVGVLIVNIHLLGLGLPSAELTQTRYVLVGTLWMILVGVMFIVIRLTGGLLRVSMRAGFQWRGFAALALVALLFFLGTMLISRLTFHQTSSLVNRTGAVATIIAIITAGIVMPAPVMLRRFRAINVTTDIGRLLALTAALAIVCEMIFGIVALGYYATYSYPNFSTAIGGSASYDIFLKPIEGKQNALHGLHLDVRGDGLIGPCELVFEDANTYFIRIRRSGRFEYIRVAKSLFDGAISTR